MNNNYICNGLEPLAIQPGKNTHTQNKCVHASTCCIFINFLVQPQAAELRSDRLKEDARTFTKTVFHAMNINHAHLVLQQN